MSFQGTLTETDNKPLLFCLHGLESTSATNMAVSQKKQCAQCSSETQGANVKHTTPASE